MLEPTRSSSDIKAYKKIIGNEKRLQAENAKRMTQKANIASVQQALKNIDNGSSGINKRIVFRDESDEEQSADTSVKKTPKEGNQLFSDDSDENDDSPEEPSFHVREQFEGDKGQKLFELHSKFNNDSRFRIDRRFLEKDNVDKSSSDPVVRSDNDEDGMEEPRVDKEANEAEKQKEADNNKNTYYFAVSQNLSNLFSSSKEKPKFSMLGNQEDNNDSLLNNKVDEEETVKEKPSKKFKPNSENEVKAITANPFKPSGWFFIRPGDECLKESCQFFCRQDTEEDMRAKWTAFRPSILEGFRKLKKGHGKPKSKWKQVNKNQN